MKILYIKRWPVYAYFIIVFIIITIIIIHSLVIDPDGMDEHQSAPCYGLHTKFLNIARVTRLLNGLLVYARFTFVVLHVKIRVFTFVGFSRQPNVSIWFICRWATNMNFVWIHIDDSITNRTSFFTRYPFFFFIISLLIIVYISCRITTLFIHIIEN